MIQTVADEYDVVMYVNEFFRRRFSKSPNLTITPRWLASPVIEFEYEGVDGWPVGLAPYDVLRYDNDRLSIHFHAATISAQLNACYIRDRDARRLIRSNPNNHIVRINRKHT